jgi:hypothetical protein
VSQDYVGQLVVRIQTQRQARQLEELKHELAWRKRSRRELEEGAARKLPLGINLDRFETAAFCGLVRARFSAGRRRGESLVVPATVAP